MAVLLPFKQRSILFQVQTLESFFYVSITLFQGAEICASNFQFYVFYFLIGLAGAEVI